MRPRVGRGASAVLAAALALSVFAALAPASPAVSSCAAAGQSAGSGPNHVALVIEHGDGSVVNVCVSFSGATITGKQMLDTAGIAWSGQSFGSFGEAVCALDGEPAHYSTCPGKDNYWAFFASRAGGAWQFATAGVSTITFSSGDAEGFRYVPSTGTPAAPPSPAGVCATSPAATATPAPTAPAAATPRPTARPTASQPAAAAATSSPLVGATEAPAATNVASTDVPATDSGAATDSPGSGDVAAATAIGATPSTAASPSPAAPAPSSGGGVDAGLLLAAIVGGGLGGLAVLRLFAARRPPGPPIPPGPTNRT